MLISGESSGEAEKEAAELAAQITFKVSYHSLYDIHCDLVILICVSGDLSHCVVFLGNYICMALKYSQSFSPSSYIH